MYDTALSVRLQQYADAHRNPTNALIHAFAVPFTMLGIIGLLPFWLAISVLVSVLIWYARLDWSIVVPMGIVYGASVVATGVVDRMFHLGPALWGTTVGIFLGLQVLGHVAFEKNRPSFADNLSQLFIGPVYYLALRTGRWRTSQRR